ncbi:MAG: DUF1918 domain-containing protein [Solirubrobacteraceae bacterium]
MATKPRMRSAHVGDWVEARGLYGQPARRGQIVQLIGGARHERYRVRWDEQHESILYPADGVLLIPRRRRTAHSTKRGIVTT